MNENLTALKEQFGADAIEKIMVDLRTELEKEYQTQLDLHTKELSESNQIALETAISDFKKQQAPPTQEDISKMLSQEYLSYTVKVFDGKANKEVEFTLREMPLVNERKLYALIRDKVIPRIKDLNMLNAEFQHTEEVAQAFFSLVDPASELLGEACAIILDPWGTNPDINKDWVLNNLSSIRIWNIISAQMEVNRMRDFFSGVSQTSRRGRMTPAVNTRR